MSPMAFNILIIISAFVIGFLIGREVKIMKYEDRLRDAADNKDYWIDICKRQTEELALKPPPSPVDSNLFIKKPDG